MTCNEKLLARARRAVRVSEADFDAELMDLINAAQADLNNGGVLRKYAYSWRDPLVLRAVITYVKAHFGVDNPEADRFAAAYADMRSDLMTTKRYTQRKEVEGE